MRELVKYDTAKLAKQKGFNWDCEHYYDIDKGENSFQYYEYGRNNVEKADGMISDFLFVAPTQSVLQRWLREKNSIDVLVLAWKDLGDDVNDKHTYRPMIYNFKTFEEYPTYEEALEKGLKEGLKLIK